MLSATTSVAPPDQWHGVAPSSDLPTAELSSTCALLALMVQNQCTSQSSSRTDVDLDFKRMQELKQQLADAIQQAKEASEKSGFWGFLGKVFGSDIAQIAGAVAAIAAVVATGGAAAPLIVMAVSAALEEGAKIGAQLGLDPKICMAIGLAGAAVALCSGGGTAQGASTLAAIGRDVKFGAECAQAGASAAGTALGYVAQHYYSKQLGYQADATGYQAQDDATSIDFDSALALLQQALRTEQRETSTVSAILQNDSLANSAISDRI